MSETSDEAVRILRQGSAQDTAVELLRILRGSANAEAQAPLSFGWVADAYASVLNEDERAQVRNAIVLMVEELSVSAGAMNAEYLVALSNLSADLELLKVTGIRLEERLWNAVEDARTPEAACAIVNLLAEQGRVRTTAFWTETYERFGVQTAMSLTHAMLAQGVETAIRWVYETIDAEARHDVIAAYAVEFARRSPGVVRMFLDLGRAGRDTQIARDLQFYLARYGIGTSLEPTNVELLSVESATMTFEAQPGYAYVDFVNLHDNDGDYKALIDRVGAIDEFAEEPFVLRQAQAVDEETN